MEMNNSVFYKVNSNSSCFADIKLSQNIQTLKLENHHLFLCQTKLFPRSSGFRIKYYMATRVINQPFEESQHSIFHGRLSVTFSLTEYMHNSWLVKSQNSWGRKEFRFLTICSQSTRSGALFRSQNKCYGCLEPHCSSVSVSQPLLAPIHGNRDLPTSKTNRLETQFKPHILQIKFIFTTSCIHSFYPKLFYPNN